MAITAAVTLPGAGDDTDLSVYTTASQTPSSNRLILVAILNFKALSVAPAPSSVAGNGLTWVQVRAQANVATDTMLSVWRAMGEAPTAGALTITFPSTQQAAAWCAVEFNGVETGGTNGSAAVMQSAGGTANAASLVVTLAAFTHVDNATVGCFYGEANPAPSNIDPGAGFTELTEGDFTTPPQAVNAQWKSENDTTVDASVINGIEMSGIALEVKAAGPIHQVIYSHIRRD